MKIKEYLDSYWLISTINGVRYFSGVEHIRITHRVAWLLLLSFGLILSITMSIILDARFKDNYTLTKFDSNMVPSENVFPCVTLCNINKVSKKKFEFFIKILKNYKVDVAEILDFAVSLEALVSFSTYDYTGRIIQSHQNIFGILGSLNYTVEDIMYHAQPDCKSLLADCRFKSLSVNCTEYFRIIKSMEGYCCSFNYAVRENELVIGRGNETKTEIPQIITDKGTGLFGGLTVIVNIESDDYLSPSRPMRGIVAMISYPTEYPETAVKFSLVQPGFLAMIKVTVSTLESTPDVGRLPLHKRLCLFDNELEERREGAEDYTMNNCITDCRIDEVKRLCGCTPFFYDYDERNTTCKLSDASCLKRYKGVLNSVTFVNTTVNSTVCDCVPKCMDQRFEVKVVKTWINESFDEHIFSSIKPDQAVVIVSIRNTYSKKYITEVSMDWHDLLMSYGGVLALCLGASVITLIELASNLISFLIKNYKEDDHGPYPFIH